MACEISGIPIRQEWDTFAIILRGKPVLMGQRWVSLSDIIKAASGVFGLPGQDHVLIEADDHITIEWDGNHRIEIASGETMRKYYGYTGTSNIRADLQEEIAQKLFDKAVAADMEQLG